MVEKRIYKYKIEDRKEMLFPAGAEILHVDRQDDHLFLWALVTLGEKIEKIRIRVYGTGDIVEEDGTYQGTVFVGPFVWHVYTHSITNT